MTATTFPCWTILSCRPSGQTTILQLTLFYEQTAFYQPALFQQPAPFYGLLSNGRDYRNGGERGNILPNQVWAVILIFSALLRDTLDSKTS